MKLIICLFVLLSVPCFSHKYIQKLDDERPFRMGKLNTVLAKAKMVLSQPKLSDLFADLIIQDKKERELKHSKAAGLDSDGLIEAEVRQALADILEKHHLMEHFPTYKEYINKKPGQFDIKDAKLRKIWREAGQAGFSDEEMKTLKEEMNHHQQKVDMFESLKIAYDELEGQVGNSLEDLDEKEVVWKNLSETKMRMKEKHKELNSNYDRLHDRLKQFKNEREFDDPRVHQLWSLAKTTDMTEDELRSFRKELDHFEHRIRKAKYLSDQVKNSISQDEKEAGADRHMQAQQYHAKVNKYHEDLKYRIQKRLDEL